MDSPWIPLTKNFRGVVGNRKMLKHVQDQIDGWAGKLDLQHKK
jgi:hypothetical protein